MYILNDDTCFEPEIGLLIGGKWNFDQSFLQLNRKKKCEELR